ncbi:MAG TPA: tyrosine-type recombinase/integrase [Streptosporangiaceae bacterium]|nr:tyrosine-type recombinase/integrase [Streptosporangiaceae bacterium]
MSAALAGLTRLDCPGDGAEDLWRHLDPVFLAGAGWNPGTQTLTPSPDHPLLGYRVCLVRGCTGQGLVPDELCATCRSARRLSGLSTEEFIAAGPVRARHCGEVICSAEGCPRPVRTSRLQLCYAHEHRRRSLGLPLAGFLRHPQARPLPGFGPCKVAVCTRQAHARRGLCRAHDVRWWEQLRAGTVAAADFGAWCRSSAPVASGHEVVMRGLAPLVQAQILLGLQERCRQEALTYLGQLRVICRRLLAVHAQTIIGFDDSRFARQHRALARDLQQAVLLAGTSPEDEQRKDIWNTVVLGHGRRRVIDFTGISQPWLREAVKMWAAGELPTRRGDHATAILQNHVRRVEELSDSLRLHRDDHGDDPRALGRGDIIAFLSRIRHRQATGQMSSWHRSTTCRQVAMILRECRALGLTRPGQPMSGLPDDFAVRRDDIPKQAADDEPGRALPAGVLNQLITALPLLERSAGPALRAAVELLMETGRRPTEVCRLGWDCLGQDSDGKYALIYTDFKANRAGRRLPVTDQTAKVIMGQQDRVRARYPDTPASELALFPRSTRNRAGKRPVVDSVVASHHRVWADSLPALQLEDGRDFDKAAVFLYAYRHSFAQRHADAGTPVDVLKDLMGHRSMNTTQLYYSVTAKRVRAAVDTLAAFQFDRGGDRVWSQARALVESEHQRLAAGQIAVPFGVCSEPSNVKAGGGACPFRFRCLGCGHFRSDPSYLPELRDYLDTLLQARERIRSAQDIDEWARAEAMPSDEEITRLRQLIRRAEHDLGQLGEADRRQITQAVEMVRATRRTVHPGMPGICPPMPGMPQEGLA